MSFRAFIVLTVAASAVAFAPSARRVSRGLSLTMSDMTELPGAVAPLGFFDPVGEHKHFF